VVAKSVPKPRSQSKIAAKPVQQRLAQALATLTDPSVPSPHCVVSLACHVTRCIDITRTSPRGCGESVVGMGAAAPRAST
jgi:hypothetical protein